MTRAWAGVWTFTGNAGDAFAIEMTSEDFDTYLHVGGPGIDSPLSDDDGRGATNSRAYRLALLRMGGR